MHHTSLRTIIKVKGVAGVVRKLEGYRKGVCVAKEKIESNVKKTSLIGSVSYAFERRKKAKVEDPLMMTSRSSVPKDIPRVSPRIVSEKLAFVSEKLATKAHPLPKNANHTPCMKLSIFSENIRIRRREGQ
jgi:hypothetical protein